MQPIRYSPAHRSTVLRLAVAAALPAILAAGCHKSAPAPKAIIKKKPLRVSDADIQKYRPNEAGAIMVVMYHRIRAEESSSDLNRPPALFRKDLETLEARGYYPVNASDIVNNTMDVPIGKTPIALTFDDSLPTQFHIVTGKDGQPHIDPDCAVGIMETFSKKHSDWPAKATFFVLPKEGKNFDPFGQTEYVGDKFSYLQKKGYEVANHTSTHNSMRGMTAAKVRWELATAQRDIKAISPDINMDIVALPYGQIPRAKDAQAALLQGEDKGTAYQLKAVFLAAWRPILSPVTLKDKKLNNGGEFCVYDPARLERVKPDSRQAKAPGTLEYWLDYFQKNSSLRYVSDGNPKICTVPPSYKNAVDEARVRAAGQTLQVYGMASGKGKGSSGTGLSVE